jgi:hypothetical protein
VANEIRRIAERLFKLERTVRDIGSGAQLAYTSLEDGAIDTFNRDGTQVMTIGRQWDGTYVATSQNGPTPPTPTNPSVIDGTESAIVSWDGTFAVAGTAGTTVLPMDFLRVDIHIGTTVGFSPAHDNRVGSIAAPTGGEVTIGLAPGTYYFKLVCWTAAGAVSAASDGVEGDAWPVVVSSDGFAPASSPAVQVIGGFDIIHTRWTPIVNFDTVTYDVHISTTSGFTPDSTTLVGSTQSSAFTIKQLPGAAPAPGDPDTRKFDYFTPYYVKIIARDADGSAAPGAEGFDTVYQMTGVNLSADSVTAAHVAVGTLTGDLFSASVILSGAFRTAETGQRVEMTPLGFFAYKADGSIMLKIPTDSQDALFDGELVVRGATVLGGMSIQSSQNELTADAVLKLMRGIVSPTATPQISDTWDSVTPSTSSLTNAQKTNSDPTWGLGGPFDLVASEVSCIEWRVGLNCWSVFQQRPNGTREWYINAAGNPVAPLGAYFSDFKDWEVWSATEIIGGSLPAQNGHFLLLRYMPAGQAYRIWAPSGIYSYTRQNTAQPPVLGNDGNRMFIAEVINTNQLDIRYYEPVSGGGNMPAAITAYTSAAGYSVGTPLAAVVRNPTGFDLGVGATRYMTCERGNGSNNRIVYTSGTNEGSVHPHGTTAVAGSWTQTTNGAGSFESPTTNRRCTGWDGTQFWTLSADGKMYKHTGEAWDPSVTSSTIWSRLTFRDTDVGGTGTHETTPGTAKSFVHKRRSKLQWTAPSVPDNGGLDDPDRVVLYAARGTMPGNVQPANAGMWKQTEALSNQITTYVTLATSGTNPPTVNSFPAANAALITNDNAELFIDGTGYGRFRQLFIGADEVLANPPYWNGWLNAAKTGLHNTFTTIDNWVAEGSPNSTGITIASGIFTVPRAGRYNLKGQLYWGAIASPAGNRVFQAMVGASTVQSHTCLPHATIDSVNQLDKDVRLTAGATVSFRFRQQQGTTIGPMFASVDLSWVQVKYIGP